MRNRLIFTLLVLFALVGTISAQTVESVLRALQQRKMMLHIREQQENTFIAYEWFQWGDGIPIYPNNGEITNVSEAVKALGLAAGAFESMKDEFVAFDEDNKSCVNVRNYYAGGADGFFEDGSVEYGDPFSSRTEFQLLPMRLPLLGEINELNWREKLRLLASNVDQLRALQWPVKAHKASAGYDWFPGAGEPTSRHDLDETKFQNTFGIFVNFPDIGPAGGFLDKETINLEPNTKLEAGSSRTVTLLDWHLQGFALDVNDTNGTLAEDSDMDGVFSQQEVEAGEGRGGWHLNGFHGKFEINFATGVRASVAADPTKPLPGGLTPVHAKFHLYKAPQVTPFGDLAEPLAAANQLKCKVGNLTLLTPANAPAEAVVEYSSGDFSAQFGDELTASVYPKAKTFLDLGTINLTSVTAPMVPHPCGDSLWLTTQEYSTWDGMGGIEESAILYIFKPNHDPSFRKGSFKWPDEEPPDWWPEITPPRDSIHRLCVGGILIAVPQFEDCMPAPAKRVGPRLHLPGQVEPTIEFRDLVRIHLGRGKDDLNQESWLTARSDGFGTLRFTGSPRQFEVLYETDPELYGDSAPIGGKTFDSAAKFSEEEVLKSGWPHRFNYICEWFSPRLRQVKGGDILVDITYNDLYTKTLKFYWLTDVGPKSGKFYSGTNPFKEIVLKNPKAGGATLQGLPNVKEEGYHLDVTENGLRLHRISLTGKDSVDERFRVEVKPAADPNAVATHYTETKIPRVLPPEGSSLNMQPWEITSVNNGVTLRSTIDYGIYDDYSGLTSSETIPYYVESWSTADAPGTPKRRVESAYDAGDWTYTSTGPEWWDGNGSITRWKNGMLDEQKWKVQGKTFSVKNVWNEANTVCTSVSKLDDTSYREDVTTYNSLREWVAVTNSGPPRTTTLRDGTSTAEVPWSLEKIQHPGGYVEKSSLTTTATEVTSVAEEGWGDPPINGSVTTTKTKLNGGLNSRVVTMGGVEVDRANATLSNKWGAPTEIQFLRGEKIKYEYEETGANWHAVKKVTDPYAVVTTYAASDWLGRATTWANTHGESFTGVYTDPLKSRVNLSDGKYVEQTFNPFGESRGSKSQMGVLSESAYSPENRTASVTVDGRTKTGDVDTFGVLTRIKNGLGSRGQESTFGVDAAMGTAMLYTEMTQLTAGDAATQVKVKTYYDAQGRVKHVIRPTHAGGAGQITETWEYDDANRKVTHYPAPGPVLNTTTTTVSPDGGTTTVNIGGHDLYRTIRSVAGGKITEITELNNDSENGNQDNPLPGSENWEAVSRTEVTPKTQTNLRETVTTPWNLTTIPRKVVEGVPGSTTTTTIFEGTRQLLTASKQFGVPSSISGIPDGRNVSITTTRTNGRVSAASGSIGGQPVGFETNAKWQVSQVTSPGSVKDLTYSSTGNYSTFVQDTAQGTQNTFATNSVGDFIKKIGDGDIDLWGGTADLATGFTSGFGVTDGPSSMTLNLNPYREKLSKAYVGTPFQETIARHADGTIQSRSVSSYQTQFSYTNNPDTVNVDYPGYLSQKTTYFKAGPRSKVVQTGDGQSETRKFKYHRLALKEENHTVGPLAGWKVELLQDSKGRLGTITATKGTASRSFTLGYDQYSRLQSSTAAWPAFPVTATHARNTAGRVNSLTRRNQSTTWNYDIQNIHLLSVTNSGSPFNYTYSGYDSRHRIGTRLAGIGSSWASMSYDAQDRLRQVVLPGSATRFYGYDNRNNRVDQGSGITLQPNALNQITLRTLTSRGFGVMGSVYPGAVAEFYYNLNPSWANLNADPTLGTFYRWHDVPIAPDPGAIRITGTVKGTRTDVPPNGATAVSTMPVNLLVPPASETLEYDDEGRLEQDAWWNYQWDGKGRLTQMTRRAPMPEADMMGESVVFAYDADGRRIKKSRVVNYTLASGKPAVMETSTMLWAGWLPLCEEKEKNGAFVVRRWFQWGADVSHDYEGAGGIGGLVAIHEETKAGTATRTLLPLQDGLGNITGVVNAADNQVIARYDFGPYGETLGESGEVECCPFRWQTKYYDAESQHYYFGYRHYDPRLGRWLSRDPLGEAGGFNVYAYCKNDPVNKHDPLGLRVPRTDDEAEETLSMWLELSDKSREAMSESVGLAFTDPAGSRRMERISDAYGAAADQTYRELSVYLKFGEKGERDSLGRLLLPGYWDASGFHDGEDVTALSHNIGEIDSPALTELEERYLREGFNENGDFIGISRVPGASDNSGDLFNLYFAPSMIRGAGALAAGSTKYVGKQAAGLIAGLRKAALRRVTIAKEGGQTTILGENMMQRVIPFAEKTNARTLPFGTTAEQWAKMTPRQRWKLNDGALRARINEGDSFRYIGQDPFRNPLQRQQFDLTGSELLRLNERGIPYEVVSPEEVMSVLGRP